MTHVTQSQRETPVTFEAMLRWVEASHTPSLHPKGGGHSHAQIPETRFMAGLFIQSLH